MEKIPGNFIKLQNAIHFWTHVFSNLLTKWFISFAWFPVFCDYQLKTLSHNDHTKIDKIPKSSDYWPNSEDTAIYNVENLKWNDYVLLESLPSSPYNIWK